MFRYEYTGRPKMVKLQHHSILRWASLVWSNSTKSFRDKEPKEKKLYRVNVNNEMTELIQSHNNPL